MFGEIIDILTVREFNENSVGVSNNMDGLTSIFLLQNKKTFNTFRTWEWNQNYKDELEKRLFMMDIYRKNFDWIQQQHQDWLKENKTIC